MSMMFLCLDSVQIKSVQRQKKRKKNGAGSNEICPNYPSWSLNWFIAVESDSFATSWNCSLPGSTVHGFFQARILKRIAISFSGDFPNPGIEPMSPALIGRFYIIEPPGKPDWIISPT